MKLSAQMLRNIKQQIDDNDRGDPPRVDLPDCARCSRRGRVLGVHQTTWASLGQPESVIGRRFWVSPFVPEGDVFDVVCPCRINRVMETNAEEAR